jgi:hypothetical protein
MFRTRKLTENSSSIDSGNASIVRPSSNDEKSNAYTPPLPVDNVDVSVEAMSAVIAAAVQLSSSGSAPSSLSLGNASIIPSSCKSESTNKSTLSSRMFSSPWKKNKPAFTSNELQVPSLTNDDDNASQASPRSSFASSPTTPRTPDIQFDDGRDELLYRGIQIKEIKSTLKTLVVSDQERNPMPVVRLERPGFARVSY